MELQKEIAGQVSIDNPFVYTLEEDETVEIKSKSVQTSSEKLKDNDLNLKVEGNEVIITTDYLDKEEGFGEEYLGKDAKALNIDLSDLNLILGEGELKISLMYSEEELISLTTVLQKGKTAEVQMEDEPEEVVEEVPEPEIVVIEDGFDLTESERTILINEFGSINTKIIRQDIEGERLIVGLQLRDYKIEHSYEYPQSEEALNIQIKADKERWLRDIAATLSRKAKVPKQVNIIDESSFN